MSNPQTRQQTRLQRKATKLPPEIAFVPWGIRFFDYIVKTTSCTNPGLMELVYCLSDDGRQELALLIFNFLRLPVWKEFCEDRRIAKREAKKAISKAIADLGKADTAYARLLASVPEVTRCRRLGNDRRLHLSDILEQEASFLYGQARIECALARARCRTRTSSATNSQVIRLLRMASTKLRHAATSYRKLLTLTPQVAIGKAFEAFVPGQLAAILRAEEEYLRGMAARANQAFNKKRLGTRDLGILIRLQYFVEAFSLRWEPYLPERTTTNLGEGDLADLLEAGKAALDLPEDSTLVDAESLGRALERFRKHARNQRTCQILRNNAQSVCDGLKIRPPSP